MGPCLLPPSLSDCNVVESLVPSSSSMWYVFKQILLIHDSDMGRNNMSSLVSVPPNHIPPKSTQYSANIAPPPRSPNLAQINFGPWDLHSVIFPDPPLCLLIPLTANLITDGQEIQKSSWEEILLTEPKKSLFMLEKKIYFWPNIPQGWRQVAVTDWIQIWCK